MKRAVLGPSVIILIPPGVSGPLWWSTVAAKLVVVNSGAPVDDLLGVSTRSKAMKLCGSEIDMDHTKAWYYVGSWYTAPPVDVLPIGKVVSPLSAMSESCYTVPAGTSCISASGRRDIGTSGTEEAVAPLFFFFNYLQHPMFCFNVNTISVLEEKMIRKPWQMHHDRLLPHSGV